MMETIFTQLLTPSEFFAGLGVVKKAFNTYYDRKDTVVDNRDDLDRLIHAYKHLNNTMLQLVQSLSAFDFVSQNNILIHARTVKENQETLQSLKKEVLFAKITDRVKRMRQTLKSCEDDSEKIMQYLSEYVVPVLRENQTDTSENVYVPDNNVPPNPPRLTLDYSSSLTCEGRLKAAVLDTDDTKVIQVVAHGMGGVGKTCALQGLAQDIDVKQRFPGGLLHIQLGNDATLSTLIRGIATLVQRTGNRSLAQKLKVESVLQEAVNEASIWFRNQTCLFLVDDIWLVNGISSSVMRILGTMLNDNSRLVYTTRAQQLKNSCGKVIKFTTQETYGDRARRMLMTHAGFSWKETLSKKNEDAVIGLLQICNGLPIAIGVVGGAVRRESERRLDIVENTWSHVYDKIRSKKECIADSVVEAYGSVRLIVDASLDFLQTEHRDVQFDEKFRALCVIQKQQMVPIRMLRNLWGLPDLDATENVVLKFDDVSLVRMMRDESQVLVQIHDVILDIAIQKASERYEVQKFWQSLIDNYVAHERVLHEKAELKKSSEDLKFPPDGKMRWMRWCRKLCCLEMNGVVDESRVQKGEVVLQLENDKSVRWEWWNFENDEYIHDNVCWALRGAKYEKQLLWLLSKPQWIVSRLQNSGISAVERDIDVGKRVSNSPNCRDEEMAMHLEMTRRAARMGCMNVHNNPREAWFQIHGRLLRYATQCERTKRFVDEIEVHAPRPWIKASVGFLQQASATALDIVQVSGYVYSLHLDAEGFVCCWVGGTAVGTTYYTFASGISESRQQECNVASEMLNYPYQNCVCISEDSKTMVIGLSDGSVWIWDTESCETKRTKEHHNDSTMCVDVSKDGKLIASGSLDGTVRIWEASSGESSGWAFIGHQDGVECVAWSANGRRIASGSRDKTIRIWEVLTGEAVGQELVGHTDAVTCVLWKSDGKHIVSGSKDKTVRFWDAENGRQLGRHLEAHKDAVLCLSWSIQEKFVVSGSRDNTLRVWDVNSGQAFGKPLVGHTSSVYCAAWSDDEKRILSGSLDNSVRVWETDSGETVGTAKSGHLGEVRCVALDRNEKRILTGSVDCSVCMWDVESGKAIGEPFVGHAGPVSCVAWCPEEQRVVSGGEDTAIRIWRIESRKLVGQPLMGHTDFVRCVACSSDGKYIVSGSNDNTVRVWDVPGMGPKYPPFVGHADWVLCVAWSPDKKHVASGSKDRSVRIWNVLRGEAVGEALLGHTDEVQCIVWSSDCRFVVSGSRDGTVRVWNVESGQAVGRPLKHDFGIIQVSVNENCSLIISQEWRTRVRRIWSVVDGKCISTSREDEWKDRLREFRQQRFDSARRSWWSTGSHLVQYRRSDGIDEQLGRCDSAVERIGKLWFSKSRFGHCQVVLESN